MVLIFPLLSSSPSLFYQAIFQEHQPQLPSYSTTFSVPWQDANICLSFCFLLFLVCCLLECQNPLDDKFFSFWLMFGLIFWLRSGDPLVSQSPREFYAFHFLGQMLISCTVPCGSLSLIKHLKMNQILALNFIMSWYNAKEINQSKPIC